jgi:hypothetical protein
LGPLFFPPWTGERFATAVRPSGSHPFGVSRTNGAELLHTPRRFI